MSDERAGGNPTAIRPSGHPATWPLLKKFTVRGRMAAFFFFKKAAISLKSAMAAWPDMMAGHGRMADMMAGHGRMARWLDGRPWPDGHFR